MPATKFFSGPPPAFRHFFPLRNGKSSHVLSMQYQIDQLENQKRHDQAYSAIEAQALSTSPPSGQKAASRFASTTHSLYKKSSSVQRNKRIFDTMSEQKTTPKLASNKSTIGYYFKEKRTSMKGFSDSSALADPTRKLRKGCFNNI